MALTLTVFMLGFAVSESAYAHGRRHGRVHFGFHIGVPLAWPYWYYPPPYYYYEPRVVVVPSAPTTYIERESAPAAPAPQYWYYCADSNAYYPYVKHCPGGWQRVAPQPPS
ncbi:MAG: hypothetical protein ACREUO_00830 [Burkholderiales bacterium]